jgi:hypothetical protein
MSLGPTVISGIISLASGKCFAYQQLKIQSSCLVPPPLFYSKFVDKIIY